MTDQNTTLCTTAIQVSTPTSKMCIGVKTSSMHACAPLVDISQGHAYNCGGCCTPQHVQASKVSCPVRSVSCQPHNLALDAGISADMACTAIGCLGIATGLHAFASRAHLVSSPLIFSPSQSLTISLSLLPSCHLAISLAASGKKSPVQWT